MNLINTHGDWWYERSTALADARLRGLTLHDIVDPSNTTTPGQVFDTIATNWAGKVWYLTADVRLSGKARWWWAETVRCDHADHKFQPYPKVAS